MSSRVSEGKLPCPVCPSSDAYHKYDDGHGYCYACKAYFKGNEVLTNEFTYQYIPLRGINEAALRKFDAKTKIDAEGKPVAIGFKYPNGAYKVRSLDKKEFYSEGEIAKGGLFGRDKFAAGSHKYVTITEGELDAISLYQVLGTPCVSVQSSTTAGRDCGLDRSWLNSFERIYLAFDADEPGREAARIVAKLFDYRKVYSVKFSNRKDANEYLQNAEEGDLRNIWWNSRQYLPDTVISSFDIFAKILEEPVQWGVPYPFHTVTEMTYGIRTGESVLLTAQEGVGKTELMHAIEYQILQETKDNVCAIYLEEPKKRHLQALAGIHLHKPVHLPDSGVDPAEVISALKEAVGEDDRLHIYSHFGSNDPDAILDTIRFVVSARACRYVLLDHITMVVSGSAGEDERRQLDYLSTQLEMMVKELDFALILVSHVNDYGLTRGSRNISKVADIRIDAVRDITNTDPIERNTVHLTISKNRYCGKTGPAGDLLFDIHSYSYKELYGDASSSGNVGGTKELVFPES